MADEKEAKETEKKGGGTPVVVLALLFLNLLASGGALALLVLGGVPGQMQMVVAAQPSGDAGPAGGADAGEPDEGQLVKVEDMTVQLRNPETARYIRVAVQVQVPSDRDVTHAKKKMPVLRDAFIQFLSDCAYEDLRGSNGLSTVKSGLSKAANSVLGADRVDGVFITNFVVQ